MYLGERKNDPLVLQQGCLVAMGQFSSQICTILDAQYLGCSVGRTVSCTALAIRIICVTAFTVALAIPYEISLCFEAHRTHIAAHTPIPPNKPQQLTCPCCQVLVVQPLHSQGLLTLDWASQSTPQQGLLVQKSTCPYLPATQWAMTQGEDCRWAAGETTGKHCREIPGAMRWGISPYHAEFISENTKIDLHSDIFLIILNTEMAQAVEIVPHARQGPIYYYM